MIKPGQDWTEALKADLTGTFLRILSQNPVNAEERWITEEELRLWIWEVIVNGEYAALHANQAQAEAGIDDKKWMSPLRVAQAIAALVTWGNIQGNLADQLDLNTALGSKVSVDSLATQAQAEAGIAPDRWMSPLTTAQAIAFIKATIAEAVAGADNTKWMSPARTTDAIAAFQKSTTGTEISFIVSRVYNTHGTPATANITDNLTDARAGNVQKIYHNHSAAPTFPAGWVKLGAADYVVDVLNIIYAEWISGTRVEYWIAQESA